MANTTGLTNKVQQLPWTTDRKLELGAETVSSTTTFYDGQAVGRDSSGNMVQMDDTAKSEFIGILMSVVDNQVVNTTDSVGQTIFRVVQPQAFIVNIASATAGDEGRKVYWQYNETVAYTGLTNWNLAGYVWQVLQPTGQSTTNQVVVLPPWLFRQQGMKDLAVVAGPAGSTTTAFTKYDVHRMYKCSDTMTINLPVSTTCSNGDEISFLKTGSGAYTISFGVQGSDSINGGTTAIGSTTVQFHKSTVETDGSGNWWLLS
jgi:hypothetical protein